jgi:flagellin
MALTVVSNYAADVAHRYLTVSNSAASSSLAKLSSGSRIVSAKDDAASLAIGSRIQAEVAAMTQAGVNAGQASSMLQIADGAMARGNDILQRMKSLAVQAASGQLSDTERAILNTEYSALKSEITRIGKDTEFNSVKLLAGSQSFNPEAVNSDSFVGSNGVDGVRFNNLTYAGSNTSIGVSLNGQSDTNGNYTIGASDAAGNAWTAVVGSASFSSNLLTTPTSVTLTSTDAQVAGTVTVDLNTAFENNDSLNGASNEGTVSGTSTTSFTFKVGTGSVAAEDDLSFSIGSLVAIADGLASDITTSTNADSASGEVSTAINSLNSNRAAVGANQSRLDFAAANISTARENAEAARSQLLDLDVAMEMTTFTSKQILMQAGVSMLAQANQLPQNLLRLFQ